jgi:FkbM family methyltransferase
MNKQINLNKYFIDCGAHCGESILRARREFGNDINIISFEPIPYFAKELQKIYENDSKVVIYNKAIWTEDCIKKFNISKNHTDGSSLLEYPDQELDIEVECINFSKWLEEKFSFLDYLIVKLDIEGAEYAVLNKLIEDKSINLINELHGEFHENRILDDTTKSYKFNIDNFFKTNQIFFKNWDEHIPTLGKFHEKTCFRPINLASII